MHNILSILITTYNRAAFLDVILGLLCDYQKKGLNFNVVVSDDCSSDNTKEIAEKWTPSIKGYKYLRSDKNQGMDGNFIAAYTACETEYCWLLGDHRYVEFDELGRIISLLEAHQYDALVLKCHPKNLIPEKEYSDINQLLVDLGYNITNNASCVIPKKFVSEWAYKRFYGTTFLHMGIFVENLCQMHDFKILFISDILVRDIDLDVSFVQTGWYGHPFLNFGKLWFEFVMSLPNVIKVENKFDVLLSHNRMTGIFNINDVLANRYRFGNEYVDSYKENRQYIQYVSDTPRWRYDVYILFFPMSLYAMWRKLRKHVSRFKKTLRNLN